MNDIAEGLRALARAEHDDLSIGHEAADEIERLRAQVARLTRMLDDPGTTHAEGCSTWGPKHWQCALNERDALLARVEAAERDAGRYRWLRNESLHRLIRGPICIDADTWGEPVMACGKHITLDGATLDAAIDAAMEGGT